MNAYDSIMTRRSVRTYTDEPVTEETMKKILEAAMNAPSAGNQQPWHFIVVRDKEMLAKIPELHHNAPMVAKAQVAVIVCGEPALQKHEGYWVQDCASAVENLLLAVHALGLGAVWTGIHPRAERAEGFRKLLGIPAEVEPFALIPIGHTEEEPKTAERFKVERVHLEQW